MDGAKHAPSFARAPRSAQRRSGARHAAAIGALTVALLLQLLLADRAQLAGDARWRPWIAGTCALLRCSLPAWQEPAAFVLLQRDVGPHPARPGVLRVSATFRNDARWPQPWPDVLLTLSDLEGREAGARRFRADEYLGATPAPPLLQPGQVASFAMDVMEPAPRIVAFTFDFR